MEAWIGVIGTIAGGVIAWALGQTTNILSGRRKAYCDLKAKGFVCLDRLLKIKSADARGDAGQRDKEIWHLGGDMDKYRDCIALSPKTRGPHWAIYQKMMPILLEHDLSKLDAVIRELEELSGANLDASDDKKKDAFC